MPHFLIIVYNYYKNYQLKITCSTSVLEQIYRTLLIAAKRNFAATLSESKKREPPRSGFASAKLAMISRTGSRREGNDSSTLAGNVP